jgi:hypothetical protein
MAAHRSLRVTELQHRPQKSLLRPRSGKENVPQNAIYDVRTFAGVMKEPTMSVFEDTHVLSSEGGSADSEACLPTQTSYADLNGLFGRKIPFRTTLRLLDSVAFMNSEYGRAFNGMITVNFQQLGITTEKDACRALVAMNDAIAARLSRYCAKWGEQIPYLYAYVHEDVATSFGHHVHQLVHMPCYLSEILHHWLYRWAQRTFGASVDPRAIDYRGKHRLPSYDKMADQQSSLVRYILKSSENAEFALSYTNQPGTLHQLLEIDRHRNAYCANVRKIVGVSQNISIKSQMYAGFQSPIFLESIFTDKYISGHFSYKSAKELADQVYFLSS